MKSLFLFFIKIYQNYLSPLIPKACRFAPSCSDYAKEAIIKYGAFRGGLMSVRRILRCGPWSAGGFDPVN
ncbi:MAG: membrane protein insertion efficiency factor YidD [Alphaproteobacteria bacterium]|nr:membrane protein insertion efficiency factor YidD [Alphaproteobacteria bacterium]